VQCKGGHGRLQATAMETTAGLTTEADEQTTRSAQRMGDATLLKKQRKDLNIWDQREDRRKCC
jgi:hypothetical protein